jgi:hypothetical protein
MSKINYRKRKGSLTNISGVLQKSLEAGNSPLSEQFIRWRLWAKWDDLVGETIAQKSLPVDYREGTLFVWVNSSAWMHHLLFLRESMQSTINKKLGIYFVKAIRFTLDRKGVPDLNDNQFKEMVEKIITQRTIDEDNGPRET